MQIRRAGLSENHERPYGMIELLAAGTSTIARTSNVDLKVIVILPGRSTSRHFHLRTESLLYVEAGSVTLESELANLKTTLNVGDTVVVNIAEDHRMTNDGVSPARVIEVQSPGYQKKDTIPLHSVSRRLDLNPGRFWRAGPEIKLKVCGVRTLEVAYACYELGVEAIGFHALGPKWSRVLACEDWVVAIPEELSIFLLTDIRQMDILSALVNRLRCTAVQLQGQLSAEQIREVACALRELGVKLVKTVPVPDPVGLSSTLDFIHSLADSVDAILLDKAWYGGTGLTPDWDVARRLVPSILLPVIVAGGISEDNIGNICATVRPYGIDVESSLEWHLSVNGGVFKPKSVFRIQRLVQSLHRHLDDTIHA